MQLRLLKIEYIICYLMSFTVCSSDSCLHNSEGIGSVCTAIAAGFWLLDKSKPSHPDNGADEN